MMSVQSFSSTAPLAGIVVALQDGAPPMLVAPEAAVVSRRGAFVFPRREVTTLLAAILHLEVPVPWKEGRSAAFASESGSWSVALANQFGRTRPGTCFAGENRNPLERRATDNANPVVARFAICATRVSRRKLVSAPIAASSPCGNGRFVFHTTMIPQNAQIDKLERWATMTGREPVLIDEKSE